MNISLLATTFLEILQNEWLGIIASAFVLISFLTSNQIKTRIINSIGCLVFVIYGFLLPTYSTALMNGAMLIVHAVFLTKYFVNKRRQKKLDAAPHPDAQEGQQPVDNATAPDTTIGEQAVNDSSDAENRAD